jgi:hypothetical protein
MHQTDQRVGLEDLARRLSRLHLTEVLLEVLELLQSRKQNLVYF